MKRIFPIFVVFLMIFAVSFLFPDTGTNIYRAYPYALGVFAGELGGTGLSYQQWMGRFGYEAAFGGIYKPPQSGLKSSFKFLNYNIGLQVQYMLFSENLLRKFPDWISAALYLFTGAVHNGSFSQPYKANPDYTDPNLPAQPFVIDTSKSPVYTPGFGFGIGIGIEPVLFRHFSFPFEFGLDSIWHIGSVWPEKAGFFAQGGFRYRF